MALADTPRKKQGLGIIISHVIGVAVGIIVYSTTSTPVAVDLIITFAIGLIGSLTTILIVKPNIPA